MSTIRRYRGRCVFIQLRVFPLYPELNSKYPSTSIFLRPSPHVARPHRSRGPVGMFGLATGLCAAAVNTAAETTLGTQEVKQRREQHRSPEVNCQTKDLWACFCGRFGRPVSPAWWGKIEALGASWGKAVWLLLPRSMYAIYAIGVVSGACLGRQSCSPISRVWRNRAPASSRPEGFGRTLNDRVSNTSKLKISTEPPSTVADPPSTVITQAGRMAD